MTAPEFLTVKEVAAKLRVSPMTVYRLIHSEDLRAYRLGRSAAMRVRSRDVDDYVRFANTVTWERGAS